MDIQTRLADHYEQVIETLAEQLKNFFKRSSVATYQNMDDATLTKIASAPFAVTIQSLRGDQEAVATYTRNIITQRAQQDTSMRGEFIGALGDVVYDILLTEIPKAFPEDEKNQALATAALTQLTFRSNSIMYQAYVDVRQQQLQQREAELSNMQADFELMSTVLRELSAPIAPIHDNVLVLPLVGSIDTNRAQTITEDLLEEIVGRQSDLVIIDITGVPVVDTSIANYLLQTTRAVNLLGAQVILVGISAEVAQTIVGLDLDLRQLTVRANLQDGIEYALAQMGLGIRELEPYTDHE